MAVRLNPPKKWVFWFSTILGVIALVIYLLNILGLGVASSPFVPALTFWLALIAWGLLWAGNVVKGF